MMRQILSVNVDDLDCVVQPGITYDELNEALREYGLFFPMVPFSLHSIQKFQKSENNSNKNI
jgi:FAD/FMN-containing dehydrogenase